MQRKTFLMTLKPGMQSEYIHRHNPIWSELQTVLKAHGVHNYSIHLEPKSNTLFGYAEIESEERWQVIANTAVCKQWWAYMKDLMETNPDNSPTTLPLAEVFYLG